MMLQHNVSVFKLSPKRGMCQPFFALHRAGVTDEYAFMRRR